MAVAKVALMSASGLRAADFMGKSVLAALLGACASNEIPKICETLAWSSYSTMSPLPALPCGRIHTAHARLRGSQPARCKLRSKATPDTATWRAGSTEAVKHGLT
eukprot:1073709-Amphidinium_carterae.1